MSEVEFTFPEAGLVGTAVAFTQETCEHYVDQALRNQEDAAVYVLRRHVITPGFEALEAARREFPDLAMHIAGGLCEVAGCFRQTATTEDVLEVDTPAGVLGFAGLDLASVEALKAKYSSRLVLITVCNDDREKIFACVVRTPDDATLRLISKARETKKGFAKACRSAALNVIVWSSEPTKEAFERLPAIPALVLAARISEMGDRSAESKFRRRQ